MTVFNTRLMVIQPVSRRLLTTVRGTQCGGVTLSTYKRGGQVRAHFVGYTRPNGSVLNGEHFNETAELNPGDEINVNLEKNDNFAKAKFLRIENDCAVFEIGTNVMESTIQDS
jgi:hypothetical protein